MTSHRPDAATPHPAPTVNVFLYQVTPNVAWRNADLPTRRRSGQPLRRPRAALDLHYLLTFYGEESKLEPERLLGSVVRQLHERPVLTRKLIERTLAKRTFGFLAGSNPNAGSFYRSDQVNFAKAGTAERPKDFGGSGLIS